MSEWVVRVWREGSLSWWAELWRPRVEGDPPPGWDWDDRPPAPEGMVREGVDWAATRWGVRRKAKRLVAEAERQPNLRVESWKVER